MSGDDEDYMEDATPEQKLNIATYFLMSTPVGEIDPVLVDCKKLISEDDILTKDAIGKILRDYNIEQMTTAKHPSESYKCMITPYGRVSDTEYLDPRSGSVLTFDHVKREFTSVTDQKQEVEEDLAKQRKGVDDKVTEYMTGCYKDGKWGASTYANDGTISVCISAQNTRLSAYWTGGWTSTFTFPVEEGKQELKGSVKIHVHYFEDGNVQLHSAIEKKIEILIGKPEDTGKEVVKAIKQIEGDFHTNLEEMYVQIHRNTFKQMRRFLPIAKKPMVWNINAHGAAQGLGQ